MAFVWHRGKKQLGIQASCNKLGKVIGQVIELLIPEKLTLQEFAG